MLSNFGGYKAAIAEAYPVLGGKEGMLIYLLLLLL